jgi:dipeptidyl aminopeptidase/acylaminoacyl peptidase
VDELLGDPEVLDVALSPDGRQLAVLRQQTTGGKRVVFALLVKVDDTAAQPAAVKFGDVNVTQVEWANDERLLIWTSYATDAKGRVNGLVIGDNFVAIPVRRVISVDLEGRNPVVLFGQESAVLRESFDASQVVDYMLDDPKHILMQIWDPRRDVPALHQVDVYTGASTPIEYGVQETDGWLTQGGVPMLRVDSNTRGTVGWIYGRAPGETGWKLVHKSRMNDLKKLPDFDVVGATQDAGVFLVATRGEGGETRGIRKFDLRTLQFGPTVAEQAGHDMETVFTDARQTLLATAYVEDRLTYRFAEPALEAHFKALNAYFKDRCDVAIYETDLSHTRLIVKVTGPQYPGSFYVYHRASGHLEEVGVTLPKLSPERLAPMEPLTIAARDGARFGAYLTRPIGDARGPLPMVVMPHGGPEERDRLSFDPWVQAFAARGWLVLQPNFRGSGGFGKVFADAGRKHWGDRMQEDVEDAVAQVVASGRADPGRLAICGGSYGGYAALMGAVRKPGLYKAVVSVAGDFDLIESLAFSRREDGGDSPAYAYWLASMGDPKIDQAALIQASPSRRVQEIAAPVLLMHGSRDTICDPKQSKVMAKALKDAGKTCEYVELKGEGHRGWQDETWRTVINRSGDFIARHL